MSSTTGDLKFEALKGVVSALKGLSPQDSSTVLSMAAEILSLRGVSQSDFANTPLASNGSTRAETNQQVGQTQAALPGANGSRTAKDFLRQKNPQTDAQRVACLAYYLTHFQNTPQFKSTDLRTLNDDSRGSSFSNIRMTVKNAVRRNKFFSPLPQGKKRLTQLGEQVVEALPNQEAVDALCKAQPKARRNKNRKASAAKA